MKHNSFGFTLVELMIAIAILSALLFTGTYSYQMLANLWGKELGQFENSHTELKNLNLLNNLFRGIQPFIVTDQRTNSDKPVFLFIGRNDSLLAISRSGIFSGDFSEIFRIRALQKENGLYDLLYQGVSTENLLLLSAEQEIIFDFEFILLKDITRFSLNYLGWSSIMQKSLSTDSGEVATWRDSFSGIDNQSIPENISVNIEKANKKFHFSVELDKQSLRYLTPNLDDQS